MEHEKDQFLNMCRVPVSSTCFLFSYNRAKTWAAVLTTAWRQGESTCLTSVVKICLFKGLAFVLFLHHAINIHPEPAPPCCFIVRTQPCASAQRKPQPRGESKRRGLGLLMFMPRSGASALGHGQFAFLNQHSHEYKN